MQTASIAFRGLIAGFLVAISVSVFADDDVLGPIDVAEKPAEAKLLVWHRGLASAVEEARRRKTSILVRVGADWCGWCKRLDKEIVRPAVQKELTGWTLVLLDADEDAEEVRRLRVGPIPALRVLNSAGQPVRTHDGFLPADELILWLRGEDAEPPTEMVEDVREVPELSESTLAELARLLAHRDATVREAAVRRLAVNKGLAGPGVAEVFIRGKLGARLAALDLLVDWQAPVADLDPWRPQTITAERLQELEDWAAQLSDDAETTEPKPEPLTEQQLSEAKSEIARIVTVDVAEMEASGARLARFGDRLLPLVQEQRQLATSDQDRERLDWLRYRVVASDALVLKWPGGLLRLVSTDAKTRRDAASELAALVTHGDEPLLIELFGHPDSFVRELSLKALHDVGGPRAATELSRLLADPEPNVRAAVLKQMAESPSAKLVPQIAKYIAGETDPDLIVHAARLLREVKNEAALECLITLFQHANWQVRAEAAEAVGECVSDRNYGEQEIEPGAKADAFTALLELLNDSDGFVVSRAVLAFKGSDFAIAAAPLAKAAEQHPELATVVSEALVSGSKMQQKGEPILEGWLTHPNDSLRAAAVRSLHQAGQLDGETQLIAALADASEKVRTAAANMLLQVCDSERPVISRTKDNADAEKGSPYEEWLSEFKSGERSKWLDKAIEPLKKMTESATTAERIDAGLVLVALGVDGTLDPLLELAAREPMTVVQVAASLKWLPWTDREQTFNQLKSLAADQESLGRLCIELVALRDVRAKDLLWSVLADERVDVALAQTVHGCLLLAHGLSMYTHYYDQNVPRTPIGFDAAEVAALVTKSEHEWQRRVGLALLLQFNVESAVASAKIVMSNEQAMKSLRVDAFIATLIGDEPGAAREAAVAMLTEQNELFAPTAIAFLTTQRKLTAFADGHFHLPAEVALQTAESGSKDLLKLLKPEQLRPYQRSSDAPTAARASYLIAMLGDPSGLDRLLDYWKQMKSDDEWNKLAYEAISAGDDAKYVPILEQIYETFHKEESHLMRDFYWSIRTMHGPEILKLRKRIRDEVGMDQLR
jgi:HEAT repeat protein